MAMTAAIQATTRMREALEALAAALAAPDLEGVLASEPQLARAVADATEITGVAPADREAMIAELIKAHQALARCRALGQSLADVTDDTLVACGRAGAYGRGGHAEPRPAFTGRVMKATL
jgi:hypothetical protein